MEFIIKNEYEDVSFCYRKALRVRIDSSTGVGKRGETQMSMETHNPINGSTKRKIAAAKDGSARDGSSSGCCLKEKEMDQMINMFLFMLDKHACSGLGLKDLVDMLERNTIARVLSEFNGHQVRTAQFLHMRPTTLNEKLKKYDIGIEIQKMIYVRRVNPSPNGPAKKCRKIPFDDYLIHVI